MEKPVIFVVGDNSKWQSGLNGDKDPKDDDMHIDEITEWDQLPKVDDENDPIDYKIATINCGDYNTFFTTHDSEYFFCGENNHFQSGLDVADQNIKIPLQIHHFDKKVDEDEEEEEEEDYTGVIALNTSSFAQRAFWQTSEGIYVHGRNVNAACGVGRENNQMDIEAPTLVKDFVKVQQIATGRRHTIILNRKGAVFATKYFGRGKSFGEHGDGNHNFEDQEEYIFHKIPFFAEKKIRYVVVGDYQSYFVDVQDNVWVCGKNDYGQLGLGDAEGNGSSLPMQNKFLGSMKITDIVAGKNHVLCIDNNGACYGFGDNQYGQCGVGKQDKMITRPTPITIKPNDDDEKGTVICTKIKAGEYHSYIEIRKGWHYLFGRNNHNQCTLISGDKKEDEAGILEPFRVDQIFFKFTKSKQTIDDIFLGRDITWITADNVEEEKKADNKIVSNALVLIIGIVEYEKESNLDGVDKDVANHRNLWQKDYGFDVYPPKEDNMWFSKRTWTKKEMIRYINIGRKLLVSKNNKNKLLYDGLIVAFSGHGDIDAVLPSDYDFDLDEPKLEINSMQSQVNGKWNTKFADIPRIFIMDCCRGDNIDMVVSIKDQKKKPKKSKTRTAVHKDRYSCALYGNSKECVVSESTALGGCFTTQLCKELKRNSKKGNNAMNLGTLTSELSKKLEKLTEHEQLCDLSGDARCSSVVLVPKSKK